MKRRTFSAAGAAAGLALLAGLLVPAGPATAAVNDPYSQAIVAAGPVSYWRLGDSGATAVDELAANPGTLNGGVTTGQPGAIGGSSDSAMTFDGTNDFVALGTNASLRPSQFTVETWFRQPTQPNVFTYLARWRTFGWQLAISGGTLVGAVYGTSGNSYVVISPTRYDDGQWHHVVLSRDASTISLFVDGVAVASAAAPEAMRYEAGGAAIGRDGNANGSYYTGQLDEFALYARPLSLPEAIAHYCLGGGTGAVCNHAPSVSGGANQTVSEGTTATLDGTASSDPDGDTLTYSWQVLSTTGPAVTLANPTSSQPSFSATDDGVNQFRLTVDDGLASATSDTTVTVTNAPPAATLTTGPGGTPGTATATATFTDPGALDTHTVAFDWGDGTPVAVVNAAGTGSGNATAEHHYANDGTYAVAATVVDDDGGQGTATASVTIETPPTGGGTPPPAPRLPNASLWADGRGDGALDVRGFDITVAGPTHSNGGAYLFGGWLRLLGGTEYVTKFGVFGRSNVVSPKAVRTTPSTGAWADVADYRPGSTVATNAGAAYFDVSSRCRFGVWRPATPLPAGLYYANCRVELVGSVLQSRVTIAAEGTIDLWLRRGARVRPFVDGVSLVSNARRWDALTVWGADAEVDGGLVARSGTVSVFGHELEFGCTLLGANVTVFGDSMTFDTPTCS